MIKNLWINPQEVEVLDSEAFVNKHKPDDYLDMLNWWGWRDQPDADWRETDSYESAQNCAYRHEFPDGSAIVVCELSEDLPPVNWHWGVHRDLLANAIANAGEMAPFSWPCDEYIGAEPSWLVDACNMMKYNPDLLINPHGVETLAEARVIKYGDDEGMTWHWLYDPAADDDLPEAKCLEDDIYRYEFPDGSAIVVMVDIWSFGIHRDMIPEAVEIIGERARYAMPNAKYLGLSPNR